MTKQNEKISLEEFDSDVRIAIRMLKYAMRLFLVRLGFVGDECKQARKILLRNLSGNCSWKAGHAPEKVKEAEHSDTTEEMEVPHDQVQNS